MRYAIILLLMPFLSCSTAKTTKVTVTGKAADAKAGAVVVDGENVYYLDGMGYWDKALLSSIVTVTGYLKEKTISQNDAEEQVSNVTGPQKIILKPKLLRSNNLQ